MAKSSLDSELQSIYDTYRSSALNKDYYGVMLARYQRYNTIIEIAIAATASGSGLSGLAVFQYETGKVAWAILTAITGFLALSKPFLQLHQKVAHYSKLFTGHLDNFLQLHRLVASIGRQQEVDNRARSAFERAFERYVQLSREDDPQTNKRIHAACEDAVRKQIPSESLWWPDVTPKTSASAIASSLSVVESRSA